MFYFGAGMFDETRQMLFEEANAVNDFMIASSATLLRGSWAWQGLLSLGLLTSMHAVTSA